MSNGKNMAFIRKRWWLIPLLVGMVGLAVFWFKRHQAGQGNAPKDRGAAAVSVVAARAARTDIGVFLTGLGTITPLKTVTVRSRVDGQLMSLHFAESQLVREGDLLAVIDPRPFEAQLEQAEGQLAKDRALLDNARIDLERYRVLFTQDSVPKQQLDTQAALVRQYEAALKADTGLVDNAKLQLRYSRITAPITGKTGLRLVDQGNIVRSSDATGIVVIAQLQPITAVFSLPEDALPTLRKQMRVKKSIAVEAFDRSQKNRLATGTLTAIDNQIDTTTGTFKLKATFSNKDEGLFPNQFVNIRMLVDTRRGATAVPVSGVQRGAQGMYVYVVKDDQTVTLRSVQTGTDDAQRIEITEGIAPGEVVVVDGADKLREGSKVEVTMREDAAPAQGTPEGPASEKKPIEKKPVDRKPPNRKTPAARPKHGAD